jgi:hypothetical protein
MGGSELGKDPLPVILYARNGPGMLLGAGHSLLGILDVVASPSDRGPNVRKDVILANQFQ